MRGLALLSVLALTAITPNASAQSISFTDQTASSGLVATHAPTFAADDVAGGTVGDFNNDGYQDVFYLSGGALPDRLFINNGDGTFTDQAAAWGIAASHRGSAASAADYDGDGDLDIFVNSFTGNRLYQNQGGSFIDVAAAAGVDSDSFYGSAFGDYDLDGDLDLAVVDWNSGPMNRLFRNDGGTFTDVTTSSGVGPALTGTFGYAVRFCDMDGDRYPEILWVGDFTTSRYFRNLGDGTFSDITTLAGVNFDDSEMGHTVADYDRDGDFDWYVTTINTNNLYRNDGAHSYTQIAEISGVDFTGWGWGTVSADFDHDGWVDLAATSQSSGQFLYQNVSTTVGGPLSFQFWNIGFSANASGRALSHFDADNDGDQDLLIFPREGPLQFYRNELSGPNTHWLRVTLSPGTESDIAPHGAGSVITAVAGGETHVFRVDLGCNYLGQSEIPAHVGLGAENMVQTLTVDWPNGLQTVLTDVPADQTIHIEAGVAPSPDFRRGDVNNDGAIDVADPITLLANLFNGGAPPACEDAADLNDDGQINIADPISGLAYLFSMGVLPDPGVDCGPDPTDGDGIDCADPSACP